MESGPSVSRVTTIQVDKSFIRALVYRLTVKLLNEGKVLLLSMPHVQDARSQRDIPFLQSTNSTHKSKMDGHPGES